MIKRQPREILVAGAGIAGLTAAIALADRGFPVRIFERAPELQEIGAGLQLSPNATRLLARLGVLDLLRESAVAPPAIVLRDARTLKALARVPLGAEAERRWAAPYLVVHRADLQAALLEAAQNCPCISLITGATVREVDLETSRVSVTVEIGGQVETFAGALLVGADGVWSELRTKGGLGSVARFSGQMAWRRTLPAGSPEVSWFPRDLSVNAFLHPGFHLVAYPLRGGSDINLVAFTKANGRVDESWSAEADPLSLRNALASTAPELALLAEDGTVWTPWPVCTVDSSTRWIRDRLVLIGDAAHALTPFAAQGAAMAIEDAVTLADVIGEVVGAANDAEVPNGLSISDTTRLHQALLAWETSRRTRIAAVRKRGAFNEFVWHASGPVALARNLVLRARPSQSLAADMDWLYGWEPGTSG
ncbi:FAD-dependent monooxygenase [Pseudaminobacter sp. 19-2017]|uniref:FAD-dependent monooxygenase n=1 Tax=Pseudaminobacter soli (ex Zhang et al. 2022) TaxID=2831468 RepID=A0A942DUR3_9HYPH|nr:FAD-dependent monooxygenase [Pseudaminobacter soli]MBS3647409.1 FAD-dependent monooxygenase [Pseudaminobacter soli]